MNNNGTVLEKVVRFTHIKHRAGAVEREGFVL